MIRLYRASFASKLYKNKISLEDIKFQIWDTAGQEKYWSLAPVYYRHAQVALIVYDVTNKVGRE